MTNKNKEPSFQEAQDERLREKAKLIAEMEEKQTKLDAERFEKAMEEAKQQTKRNEFIDKLMAEAEAPVKEPEIRDQELNMPCNCDCSSNCNSCNDCNEDDFPCGCDVIVDPSSLNDCCFVWVMCENPCGNAVPQKVSLGALKQYFTGTQYVL